jgi:predicted Na+-dependent transporter
MLIILGALVMISPFAGLPMSILSWILPVLGLIALAIGVSYKREKLLAQSTRPSYEETLSPSA